MSGIDTSIDYSSLFNLSSSSGNSLLETIYSTSSGTNTPAQALDALTNAETNETKDVKLEAANPEVARDIAAFTKAVTGAKSVNALLNNSTVLKVLLTANGLSDQTSYTALAKKALLSNTSDSSSIANKLSDSNWASMAKAYNFYKNGLTSIQKSSTIASITNAYAETLWRKSLDATTPGLSSALTFRANAGSVTSVDQILGNSILRDVVTTALGLPLEIAYQSLTTQEKDISTRLDISKLKDSKFVETMIKQYLVSKANAAASSSSSGDIFSTINSLTA